MTTWDWIGVAGLCFVAFSFGYTFGHVKGYAKGMKWMSDFEKSKRGL